jgi:hypothetical protein
VVSLFEKNELLCFGVIDETGNMEPRRYEIDDVGFRMIVRSVEDIDDSRNNFTSSFMVDFSWFDFVAFELLWKNGICKNNAVVLQKGLLNREAFATENFNELRIEARNVFEYVGKRETTRITIDLLKQDDFNIEETFKKKLPKLIFQRMKDTNEQPMTEIVDLKLHVIIGKDRQVQIGYFTVRYQYISVTFLQVIRQGNVPWDWQQFNYKFSLNLQGPDGEADLREYWMPIMAKRGIIAQKTSKFEGNLMQKPLKRPNLLKKWKTRFERLCPNKFSRYTSSYREKARRKKGAVVNGYYCDTLPSERQRMEDEVREQKKCCRQPEFLQIRSDMLREWNLFGYVHNQTQGQLALGYKPYKNEDQYFVRFWAKRDSAEALEGVWEIFLYSMIASASWLMNPFTWDLASAWVVFGITVLFVMAPVPAYRPEFKGTYVKNFFLQQKMLVVVEILLQILGRAPYFHCREEGGYDDYDGEDEHSHSICLTEDKMLPYMLGCIAFKVASLSVFLLVAKFYERPDDSEVYYRTNKEQFYECPHKNRQNKKKKMNQDQNKM